MIQGFKVDPRDISTRSIVVKGISVWLLDNSKTHLSPTLDDDLVRMLECHSGSDERREETELLT